MPEFRAKDVLIIDPNTVPNPGDFVVAKLENSDEVIIRKYKQISTSKTHIEFELIALNDDWPNIKIGQDTKGNIIGAVLNMNRIIKY